jgi:hypothetical protein
MTEKRNAFRTLIGDIMEIYRLDIRDLDGKIILNWMGRRGPISYGSG